MPHAIAWDESSDYRFYALKPRLMQIDYTLFTPNISAAHAPRGALVAEQMGHRVQLDIQKVKVGLFKGHKWDICITRDTTGTSGGIWLPRLNTPVTGLPDRGSFTPPIPPSGPGHIDFIITGMFQPTKRCHAAAFRDSAGVRFAHLANHRVQSQHAGILQTMQQGAVCSFSESASRGGGASVVFWYRTAVGWNQCVLVVSGMAAVEGTGPVVSAEFESISNSKDPIYS